MQFQTVSFFSKPKDALPFPPRGALEAENLPVPETAVQPAPPPPPQPTGNAEKITQNLLSHIPGEASGFYMLALASAPNATIGTLGVLFFLGLAILILVRWLAKASAAIMITTILAYFIWMTIFDKGFLREAMPNLLPSPLGFIVAGFYSTVVTLLASAGKIR